MTEITRIMTQLEQGDDSAAEQLLPLVYDELRKLAQARLAQERSGQTLQATALVHEAYLRLIGSDVRTNWDSRGHFFAAAAEAMRRILINRARDKQRLKRGGGRARVDLDQVTVALDTPDEAMLDLDDAIQELAKLDTVAARLVSLRFFAGLSHHAAAAALGLSRRQGDRLWAYARAWLYDRLR